VVPGNDAVDTSAFENVLVAVNPSPTSRALIDTAMDLLGRGVRTLTAIHAVDSIETDAALRPPVPHYHDDLLGEARRRLKNVMPHSVGANVKATVRVAVGPAAETIRAHATYENANVIVMGRTKRFMQLGSTAVRVLRNTDRALLVIPPTPAVQTVGVDQGMSRRTA
jgi:nucleotide-binding universal stress UspA family protein